MTQNIPTGYDLKILSADDLRFATRDFATLLINCVTHGASIHFLKTIGQLKAVMFWNAIADQAAKDGRVIFAIRRTDDNALVGTVQVVPAAPENQPHRAEIAKMMVLKTERNKGLGEVLMRAAEDAAKQMGKTLLTLDTATGSAADRLYTRLGWTKVGDIPDYALTPEGELCSATVFYKKLDANRTA